MAKKVSRISDDFYRYFTVTVASLIIQDPTKTFGPSDKCIDIGVLISGTIFCDIRKISRRAVRHGFRVPIPKTIGTCRSRASHG